MIINQTAAGGIDINGIIKQYQVQAGNNISAGDFVEYVNGEVVSTTAQDSGAFRDSGISLNYTSTRYPLSIIACKLDSLGKVLAAVVHYPKSGQSGYSITLHIFNVLSDGITQLGSTILLKTSSYALQLDGLQYIEDNNVALLYKDSNGTTASANSIMYCSKITVNSNYSVSYTTLTVGSHQYLYLFRGVYIPSLKCFFVWYSFDNNQGVSPPMLYKYDAIIDVSGSPTLTKGFSPWITAVGGYIDMRFLAKYSDNTFYFAHYYTSDYNYFTLYKIVVTSVTSRDFSMNVLTLPFTPRNLVTSYGFLAKVTDNLLCMGWGQYNESDGAANTEYLHAFSIPLVDGVPGTPSTDYLVSSIPYFCLYHYPIRYKQDYLSYGYWYKWMGESDYKFAYEKFEFDSNGIPTITPVYTYNPDSYRNDAWFTDYGNDSLLVPCISPSGEDKTNNFMIADIITAVPTYSTGEVFSYSSPTTKLGVAIESGTENDMIKVAVPIEN